MDEKKIQIGKWMTIRLFLSKMIEVETDYFTEITSKEDLIFYQKSDKTVYKVKRFVMGNNKTSRNTHFFFHER